MAPNAKYRQVEAFIKNEIMRGTLHVGDRIMTEEQLCDHFKFSRMTINKALSNLNADGYIERIPGKGSFVKAARVLKPSDSPHSFSEDMRSIGLEPGSQLISYEVVRASSVPDAAARMGLADTDLVHHFVRLRTGNGKPVAISYNFVSAAIIPAIDVERLSTSFYEYVDSLGIAREFYGTEYRAVLPTPEQQELLGSQEIALLCVAHNTYTPIKGKSVPFEYTETYYNGTMYTYFSRD